MSAGNFYKARTAAACVIIVAVSACGGGSSGSSAGASGNSTSSAQALAPGAITLSWNANHESGVNSAGGGYEVSITGRPTATVPYVSGPTAPTSTTVFLSSGSYTLTVRAFAALDAQGGSSRTYSAPQTITVNVP